jgi:HlyD family secretion protein
LLVPLAAGGGLLAHRKLGPVPVVVTSVVRGTAVDAVYATGTVEAEERVVVRAKSAGSIAELVVREGARVQKGDLLARIDNPAVSFELRRGQAELHAASAHAGPSAPQLEALRAQRRSQEADLAMARQDLERVQKLVAGGALPQAELDYARTRVERLEASLAANQAQEQALRIDLSANRARMAASVQSLATRVSDTEVRAPLDGVVLARLVELGEVVMLNQPLFRVGDTSRLLLELAVDEADVARVRDGALGEPSRVAVRLYAFPGHAFGGRVYEVMPDANRERKSFLVKVRFDEPPEALRSGMTAEANIIARERPGVLLAPAEAEADGAFWIVTDGRARKRDAKIGIRDLVHLEVLDGLGEGDAVVVDGQAGLGEGRRVRVTPRAPDKAADGAATSPASAAARK